ncbi:MAG: PDDEXK nuclease domain-containing protein [Planctomycetia bacterium]|nr:PDDEXK nuclease domain-containing protein [Planctomycetia bacterium]
MKDKRQLSKTNPEPVSDDSLILDLRKLIDQTRTNVAIAVNNATTLLYWHVGERINREVLNYQRAEYGKQIVATVSRQLQAVYGKGFTKVSLLRMMQFAELFPDLQMIQSASQQLSWSHFIEILPLKSEIEREFYLTMSAHERWPVRILRKKIDDMLYERTAISQKPDIVIRQELQQVRAENVITPDLVFKDPYFLEFTNLRGCYSEKSLEDMLIVGLEPFIMELGNGFTFVERQKRMIIDGEDFFLDLLFYNRKLRRLVAIELKLGRFRAAYKGQMELYLRWLDRYERQPGEESPYGLILCAEGHPEQIELLQLENSGIKVAQYLTELPDRKLLMEQLRKTLDRARDRGLDVPEERGSE